LVITWASIGWSAVSGAASIGFGLSAASLALLGSGISVLIDLSSSLVLVWRFRHPHGHSGAERRAHLVAATGLSVLAGFLATAGIVRLVLDESAHPTVASVVVAAASLVVLPVIAARKYVVAVRVASRALRADAHITVVGATTALSTLIGLAATRAGLGFADSVAALLVAAAAGFVGARELQSRRPSSPSGRPS
jgi:divalent metal cation (Fe/Co/Zn/Cd) transporter